MRFWLYDRSVKNTPKAVDHSPDADSENSAIEKEKSSKRTCYFRDLWFN